MWNAVVNGYVVGRVQRAGPRGKRQKLSLVGLLFLLAATVALAGCQRPERVLKIGLVAPFEGRQRSVGYDAIYAARLAIRQANEEDGRVHPVALVALDDSGDPQLARQAAASLVSDPDVVAVVGHWLPETTAAARPIYEEAGMPLVILGQPPLGPFPPESLPPSFIKAYEAVTPFAEEAGPYAAPTYDGLNMVLNALVFAETEGQIDRADVAEALEALQYSGLTGTIQ